MKKLIALLLLFSLNAFAVNDYYVSASGSDSNNGTSPATAWRTIPHADSALSLGSGTTTDCGFKYGSWQGETSVGTCVHVLPGTYSGNEIVSTHNGNSGQKIVFISDTPWGAKIQDSQSGSCCAWVSHGTFVDIVGFDVSVTMPKVNCVSNAACDGTAGIVISGDNEKLIANNIHNTYGNFADNTCNGNGGGAITSPGGQSNVSIIGNFLHNIGAAGTSAGFCHFIHNPYISLINSVVQDNLIVDVEDGIGCTHCSNVVVSNNTIMNAGGFGTTCGSGGNGAQCIGSTTVAFGRCIAFSSPSGNNSIVNNLCVNNAAGGAAYADIVGYITGLNGLISHNLIYNPASGNGAGSPHIASINTGGGSATVTGNLLSNQSGISDPKFVSYQSNGNGDYHLQSTSAALDAATSSCSGGASVTPCLLTFDFDGLARPQGLSFDIGAYEFGGTVTQKPSPPTGLTAIVH